MGQAHGSQMTSFTRETGSKGRQVNGSENISGAEALLKSLIEEDVDTIFGYPGGAIMPVYDKLLDYEHKIKHILTRHEQGAAHAAQAYAMVTGKTGVCFATSGPGATNLITGSSRSYRNRCISGNRYSWCINACNQMERPDQKA